WFHPQSLPTAANGAIMANAFGQIKGTSPRAPGGQPSRAPGALERMRVGQRRPAFELRLPGPQARTPRLAHVDLWMRGGMALHLLATLDLALGVGEGVQQPAVAVESLHQQGPAEPGGAGGVAAAERTAVAAGGGDHDAVGACQRGDEAAR